jgi:excisionase family DNA binding protein
MENAVVIGASDLSELITSAVREGILQAVPAPMEAGERLLSERELGNLTGIARPTLQRLRRAGQLPFLKIGKSIRYRQSDVERVMRSYAAGRMQGGM